MKYPLAQLAVIKGKKLEEAERTLRDKKEALLQEENKLRAVEQERNVVREHKHAKLNQLREVLDSGTTSTKVQQMKQYLKVVDEQLRQKESKVAEQKKRVDAAAHAVESARQDLFKKQRDVEKLQIHRKEWDKEMKAVEEHKEAVEADELGSAMHTRKKRMRPSHKHAGS
jgi:flagellar biosynthesis chaperone FliJ